MQKIRRRDSHSFERRAIAVAFAVAALSQPVHAQEPPAYAALPAENVSRRVAPLSVAANDSMVAIPAGRYPIGRDKGPRSVTPRHEVTLGAFRIDRTEVTNAEYAEFLNALRLPVRGSFAIGEISKKNADSDTIRMLGDFAGSDSYPLIELDDDEARIVLTDGRFHPAGGHDRQPVTETTWAGARAYCVWRGGDLPTEVQWEAAARGPDDRLYPWGDEQPDARRAFTSGRTGVIANVGSAPGGVSPFGLLDMAGSVAEWTRSLAKPYPYRATDGRENLTAAGERTTRGGDYVYDREASKLTVSFRDSYSNAPSDGHRHIGFRCVS
ncbi:formylglycine-generating enzyme family protein [Agrobacterium fabrum]|uniref:formylglycine-generating enzyme family protein n=1 Tax=Agrobacterium fabrum TaxID=1176649 RepID=UPI00215840E9|nr:formylglycine-generating enzyme family protein [Agrobacterium fabrum]MCR6727725.1 formylglycine-generating enzyme family protein [Agrobacterium fabrum]